MGLKTYIAAFLVLAASAMAGSSEPTDPEEKSPRAQYLEALK